MPASSPIAVALTLLILAGCGGSANPGKTADLVRVTTFPLAKPYDPSLFDEVKPEVERVAQRLATKLKASVTERTVTVAGEPALQFDLEHGDVVEQVTFVLQGKKEYQLYCRRAKGGDAAACERLVAEFTPR
jgi:hypothetical protein